MTNLTHLKDKVNNREIEVEQSVKSNQALTSKAINPVSEESGTIQEEPFIIQGTGTNNNTSPVDTSPIGKQLEKQGNTIVYNQLLPISSKESVTTSGITFTNNNDGSWTINGTADGNAYDVILSTIVTYIKGHTYILFGNQGQGSLSTFYLADNYSGNYIHQDYGKGVIFTIYQDSIRPNIAIRVLNGTTVNNVKIVPKLTDLTKWFNGNENIPQDLLSHPEHWGWYYNGDLSYSTGELRNCAGRYLECGQGRNIYNPEETYNRVIPNIEYYYYGGSATTITYYDKDQTVISTESVSSGNTFTTPSNCVYINSSVTSNITISEYYSTGEEYDEYYPYVPPVTYDTGTEILRKAGSVKDTKAPDGTITYKLKQYTFTNQAAWAATGQTTGGMYRYYSELSDMKVGTCLEGQCSKFPVLPGGTIIALYNGVDAVAFGYSNKYIQFLSTTNLTPAEVQELFTGVDIIYRLATPTTEQGTAFSENIQIHDYSYQAWKDTSNNYVAIPQGTKLFYPADYVAFVDSLVKYTNGDAENIALMSDLLPKLPDASSDGTYTLKATKSDNTITYSWVLEENQ